MIPCVPTENIRLYLKYLFKTYFTVALSFLKRERDFANALDHLTAMTVSEGFMTVELHDAFERIAD